MSVAQLNLDQIFATGLFELIAKGNHVCLTSSASCLFFINMKKKPIGNMI